MKSEIAIDFIGVDKSLSARRVWIEIVSTRNGLYGVLRHSPQGECGLKYGVVPDRYTKRSHSPQGECGLK